MHWAFPDPAAVAGTDEERLAKVRAIRDVIRDKIEAWCAELTGRPCLLIDRKKVNR